MRYKVYTDGSCSYDKQKIGVGYLVYTSTNLIGIGGKQLKGKSPRSAEELAVYEAIKFILKEVELEKEDEIFIYTDCLRLVKDLKRFKQSKKVSNKQSMSMQALQGTLRELEAKCNWKVEHVQGHSLQLNGNSLVDRLAKYYLLSKGCTNVCSGGEWTSENM